MTLKKYSEGKIKEVGEIKELLKSKKKKKKEEKEDVRAKDNSRNTEIHKETN